MPHSRPSWLPLLLLVLCGEAIFILPFVLPRVFRPTMLSAFGLDNTQLGVCFAAYGVVALVSYLIGGPVADKYPPRKLIAISLWLTGLGGFVMATYPSYSVLWLLYGYWGMTTILLFWAPMIKATRVWGGQRDQGKAFGLLDGGRGLTGALFGALGAWIFAVYATPETSTEAADGSMAFRYVILVSSLLVMAVGALIWRYMRVGENGEAVSVARISTDQIFTVLRLPAVWLLMVIILCAYVGYKTTDILSLYALEVMGYDEVEAAWVGTFLQFVRPVVGVSIGLLADRGQTTKWLFFSFLALFAGAVLFASGWLPVGVWAPFFAGIVLIAAGVYAARALYYAVMERGRIPVALTGTAVGLISLVGYTPDIFAGLLIGYFLDGSPGAAGHQSVFWMMAGFALVGGLAAGIYHRIYGSRMAVAASGQTG